MVIVYDKNRINSEYFFKRLEYLNGHVLTPNNIIALGDHPDEIEKVNGVCFNQGKYRLEINIYILQ